MDLQTRYIAALHDHATPHGFVASTQRVTNYYRIWGRDSSICGIAALTTKDTLLIAATKASIQTLLAHQHEYGQIPSNVDAKTGAVSYGGNAGRVDATLWLIIVFGEYVHATGDVAFAKRHIRRIERAVQLLHGWEFNAKHLLYVPQAGDWADEYIQSGYVLYDELLYYQALRAYRFVRERLGKDTDAITKKIRNVRATIRTNFWLDRAHTDRAFVKVAYGAALREGTLPHFVSYFTPASYSRVFDGFANSLAIIMDVFPKHVRLAVAKHMRRAFATQTKHLLPSFFPPITKDEPAWHQLQQSYYLRFRNQPHEYHNGGLWPLLTGFFAHGLSRVGLPNHKQQAAVQWANSLNNWSFPEYVHGTHFSAAGTQLQAWSAAAGIIAQSQRRIFL